MRHLRKRLLRAAAVVVGVVVAGMVTVAPDSTKAATVADQGQIFNTLGLITISTDSWAQAITTGIQGQLTGIQFQFSNTQPVTTDFAIIDGSSPSGTILFSEQVSSFSLDSGGGLYTWDVSGANLFFNVGKTFTFALQASVAGVILSANDSPGYSGGVLFRNGVAILPPATERDLAFLTYVDPDAVLNPIPLPAALPLFGTGLGILGFLGWRRRRRAQAV